jgi:uncharacterized SAM-binding protein YcdF (DUF218 family)
MEITRVSVGDNQRLDVMRKRIRQIGVFISLILLISLPAFCIAGGFLIVRAPTERTDAIVVLSGSASYIERADEAALLFKAGVAPRILVTNDDEKAGWSESVKRNPYFFELLRWRLIYDGVPETAIEVLMPPARGTHGEAQIVIDAALQRNFRSLTLVTSPYHSRRALWTYKRTNSEKGAQLDFGMQPASNSQHSTEWYSRWLEWQTISSEYVKWAYYSARY